jgi:3-methyladenine DNA glycosylase AlkD
MTQNSIKNRYEGDKMLTLIKIRQELKQNSDAHTKRSGQRFFKEKVNLYGVKTALVTKIAKQYDKEILGMAKKDVFALCEELWRSEYMEESFIACHFSYLIRKKYQPEDIKAFEKWIEKYVSNWASCDTLCNHTVAAFVEMYPQHIEKIKKWSGLKNRWVKRAAAVTLIIPARRGKFLDAILEIAGGLLTDGDDLVQKGYGWLLKAASEAHQKQVFDFVMKNKARMPRTALRYAIEKMPEDLRKMAMVK